jgi:hypothetical protein
VTRFDGDDEDELLPSRPVLVEPKTVRKPKIQFEGLPASQPFQVLTPPEFNAMLTQERPIDSLVELTKQEVKGILQTLTNKSGSVARTPFREEDGASKILGTGRTRPEEILLEMKNIEELVRNVFLLEVKEAGASRVGAVVLQLPKRKKSQRPPRCWQNHPLHHNERG